MAEKQDRHEDKQKSLLTPLLAAVVLALGAYLVYTYRDQLPSIKPPEIGPKVPTPTPTPTALKKGKETYTISQASGVKGPKFRSVSLDPLDVKNGDSQTIVIELDPATPADGVTLIFTSDNKSRPLNLQKSGAATWKTTWVLDDSVFYKFILDLTTNRNGQSSNVIVAPRQ